MITINKQRLLTTGLIIVAVVFLLLWLDSCSGARKDATLAEQNEAAYKDSIIYLKNENGTITASKLVFQRTNEELQKELNQWKKTGTAAQKELAELTAKFKKLSAIGQLDAEVRIDTIEFPYPEPIPCDFKPKSLTQKTDFFSAELFVKKDKAEIIDLYVPTKQNIVFGYKSNGLFKKPEARMEVTFSNPNITVIKSTGTIAVIEKPWYEKWWVWLITGTVLGGAAFGL